MRKAKVEYFIMCSGLCSIFILCNVTKRKVRIAFYFVNFYLYKNNNNYDDDNNYSCFTILQSGIQFIHT
jgi:hypothetical protein